MAAVARASRIRNPALFICDIQEKFRPAIYEYSKVYAASSHWSYRGTSTNAAISANHDSISTADKLLRAASSLKIPVYVTTQNRARLGDTVTELQRYIKSPDVNVRADVDKTLFSMITPEIKTLLPTVQDQNQTPLDAVIVGIETHICVTQTALDLLELGHRVYIIVDGVSSINPEERGVALARLRDAGVIVTTSESILFEILQDAKRAEFKATSGLVKETKEQTKKALEVLARI